MYINSAKTLKVKIVRIDFQRPDIQPPESLDLSINPYYIGRDGKTVILYIIMSDFMPISVCVLGRQPELGLAELESLYGPEIIRSASGCALLGLEPDNINFQRLGGTLKLGRVLTILPSVKWSEISKYITKTVPHHAEYITGTKLTVGVSSYGFKIRPQDIYKMLRLSQKTIRGSGRSMRIVPNQTPALSTAQVLHNKLTHRGKWELLLIRDGHQTIIAQSLFVQDIQSYVGRDRNRPKRDAKVGMLPPKLAQIIINLAAPRMGPKILDPFCGSGVILQEALLMGFDVVGSDIDERMISYAGTNLDWLASSYRISADRYTLAIADARNYVWPKARYAVATEIYLGPALHSQPSPEALSKLKKEIDKLLKVFLANLHKQLPIGGRLCVAIPVWRANQDFHKLPTVDHLTDMGYTHVGFLKTKVPQLIYIRPNQIVGRQLLVLKKINRKLGLNEQA